MGRIKCLCVTKEFVEIPQNKLILTTFNFGVLSSMVEIPIKILASSAGMAEVLPEVSALT